MNIFVLIGGLRQVNLYECFRHCHVLMVYGLNRKEASYAVFIHIGAAILMDNLSIFDH